MFLNFIGHLVQRILGAGEEILLRVNHIGQGFGVFGYGGYIGNASDINAAVAYKNADPGRLCTPDHRRFERAHIPNHRTFTGDDFEGDVAISNSANTRTYGFHGLFAGVGVSF